MDPIAILLASTPDFKGKWRLHNLWCCCHRPGSMRQAQVAGQLKINCELRIPYEAGVWLGLEETMDLDVLGQLLKPGQTFIDCGANIGLWTLHAAALVGDSGCVHCFEPHPETFHKLQANIFDNGLESRVFAQSVALGDHSGTVGLLCHPAHNLNRIVEKESGDAAVQVCMDTLDHRLSAHGGAVHGLKIDVEGHEAQVLAGASELLKRHRPWVCIEFNPALCSSNRLHDWVPHRLLASLGYCASFMTAPERAVPDSFVATRYLNILYQ